MENFEKKFSAPVPKENSAREIQRKKDLELIALAIELYGKVFPFPGIDSGGYLKMKAVEEEHPDYTTPIDTLMQRFETEGIKVTLGRDPSSGNVYILPGNSHDIENDGTLPRYLQVCEGMDEKLKKLILLNRI